MSLSFFSDTLFSLVYVIPLEEFCENMVVDVGVLLYFFKSVDYAVTEELCLRYSFSYLLIVFLSSW